jgi:hypothetical protein
LGSGISGAALAAVPWQRRAASRAGRAGCCAGHVPLAAARNQRTWASGTGRPLSGA